LFSILLFYSTVCFHFAEQINDDDDEFKYKYETTFHNAYEM